MQNEDKHTIRLLLKECKLGKRSSQKELYRRYYNYGMTVCLHYSKNEEEAQEIFNDGFMKVFQNLDKYQHKAPFKSWLRRILINTAIDYNRKHHKYRETTLDVVHIQEISVDNLAVNELSLNDVLKLVQKLSPGFRLVFNLYEIEGYKHHEIAEKLNISVGTSKSNLAKARKKLRWMLAEMYPERVKKMRK